MPTRPPLFVPLLLLIGAGLPALAPQPGYSQEGGPPLLTWQVVQVIQVGGTVVARLAPAGTAAPVLGEDEVTIQAGEEVNREGDLLIATGGVTVTQGPVRLTAEKITWNQSTGEITAEGNVVYTEPGRTVRGQRVVYNLSTRRARAAEAETVVQGVIVRAGEIDADPSRYTVLRATITTCDLPRPHYRLTAREVVITPNDRIVARKVGVWLLGTRLFVVPRLVARIGESSGEQRESPFPRVGSNSRDGFYVQKVFPVIEQPRLYVDLDARLSIRRALTGGFNAAAPAGRGLQWIGALKYRDDAPNQRTRFLEVDRVPEVGVLWVSPDPTPRSQRRGDGGTKQTGGRGFRINTEARRNGEHGAEPPMNADKRRGKPSESASPPSLRGVPGVHQRFQSDSSVGSVPPCLRVTSEAVAPSPTPSVAPLAPSVAPLPAPVEAPAAVTAPDFRPLRQVGSDVAHQPGLLQPPRADRWYVRAQSTIGYFHQRESSAEDDDVASRSRSRLDFRATAARAGLRIGGISLPVFQLFVRHSFYDDGNSFSVFGLAARQDWRWGSHWSSSLRAFWHKTNGQTPFRFDQVEIRTELQPALAYTTGGTTLSWAGRLDVDRRHLFDQEFGIARILHCFEPRLSYRTRRRQISLDLRIVGLDFD